GVCHLYLAEGCHLYIALTFRCRIFSDSGKWRVTSQKGAARPGRARAGSGGVIVILTAKKEAEGGSYWRRGGNCESGCRPCENVRAPRKRGIVFSIISFGWPSPVVLVFRLIIEKNFPRGN